MASFGDEPGWGRFRGREGGRTGPSRPSSGFTLIELMVVVAIVAILAAIALPAYMKYVVKTKRVAAEACLSEYANYMERYYTTNLRYDQDATKTKLTSATLPVFDCNTKTASDYSYGFAASEPTQTTFTLQAVPLGNQLAKDTQCGTLSIDQSGKRGSNDTASCW